MAHIFSFDEAKRARSARRAAASGGRTSSRSSSGQTSFRAQSGRSSGRVDSRANSGQTAVRRAVQSGDFEANLRPLRADSARHDEEERQLSMAERMKEKRAAKKRAHAKEKAGKAFSKQFESAPSEASEGAPRAAVYKGQMGHDHRRAARMQSVDSPAPAKNLGFSLSALFQSAVQKLSSSPRRLAAFGVAACLVLTCCFLYTPAQQYYWSVRDKERLAAEYDAVAARNAELQASVNSLQTDAGVETLAHDEYGWIKPGEHAGVVTGLELSNESGDADIIATVEPGSFDAPETWYSPICDIIFGSEA